MKKLMLLVLVLVISFPTFAKLKEIALKDPDSQLRRKAVYVIADVKSKESIDVLKQVIKTDPDTKVKKAAIYALEDVDDPAIIPVLGDLALKESDPQLAKAPANPDRMNIPEKHGTPASCVGPALEKAPLVKPVSIGFFGGELDYGTLKLLPKLFVKLIIRSAEGDYRNWNAVQEWVEIIRPQLKSVQ